ncbi:cupin domain-containing protein [Geothrix terrae]|uniref:cupin domain-containing protein n=1 Tax=Geothrix terrae TaxID=2922720 RepID=UPI001FAE7304|nr:cupin domain-containing protein [Geothrix terrae]
MKTRILAVSALTLALAALAPPALAKDGKKAGTAVLLPAGDIQWTDVPDVPGAQMATLDGDPTKGAGHFLIKLKDGFVAPLHHHTSDHFATVLSGTMSFTVDGKETLLPAGSFFVFKGKKEHITKCMPGADCVLSVDVRGKWDVVPEKAESAAKK